MINISFQWALANSPGADKDKMWEGMKFLEKLGINVILF